MLDCWDSLKLQYAERQLQEQLLGDRIVNINDSVAWLPYCFFHRPTGNLRLQSVLLVVTSIIRNITCCFFALQLSSTIWPELYINTSCESTGHMIIIFENNFGAQINSFSKHHM